MLALTETAAQVVDTIINQHEELPETAGMRITSAEGTPGEDGRPRVDLRLSVVEEPEPSDEVIEGSQVFVESGDTAELLDDKILDAEVDAGELRFSLMHQAGPGPADPGSSPDGVPPGQET